MTAEPPPETTASVTVELRLFGGYRAALGTKSVERTYDPPVTVADVMRDIEPELERPVLDPEGGLTDAVAVVLNGRTIVHLDGLETELADGDRLAVMPPLSGGALGLLG